MAWPSEVARPPIAGVNIRFGTYATDDYRPYYDSGYAAGQAGGGSPPTKGLLYPR